MAATALGVRVVVLRTGIVLAGEGGALPQMLGPTKLGMGGPIAGGRQWFPWIHVDDVVGLVLHALDEATLAGPVNLVAPGILRQGEFAKELGQAVHRPAVTPTPGFAIKLRLGEGELEDTLGVFQSTSSTTAPPGDEAAPGSAAGSSSDSLPIALWAGVGAAVVLVAGGGVWLRRRRAAQARLADRTAGVLPGGRAHDAERLCQGREVGGAVAVANGKGRPRGTALPSANASRHPRNCKRSLLDLDGTTGSGDLRLDFFGFSLVDGFLDRLRSGFNQRLGFGEAELRNRADFLDDGDLVAAVAGQDDVEFGLLFSSRSGGGGGRCGNRSSSRNAPLFFKQLRKLSRFENGQSGKGINNFVQISHF